MTHKCLSILLFHLWFSMQSSLGVTFVWSVFTSGIEHAHLQGRYFLAL